MLLPGVGLEAAEKICARLLANVTLLEIPHEQSEASEFVSISIGVVTLAPEEHTQPKDLILWADTALYEAKHNGRNQVCFYQGSSETLN